MRSEIHSIDNLNAYNNISKIRKDPYVETFFSCIVLPPGVNQNFLDSKNSQIWQIWHRYFRFSEKFSEIIFWTIYIFMINFLFCTVLSPWASEVDQTHKFDDLFRQMMIHLPKWVFTWNLSDHHSTIT